MPKKRRRLSPEEINQIVALYQERDADGKPVWTYEQIAAKVGVGIGTVTYHLSKRSDVARRNSDPRTGRPSQVIPALEDRLHQVESLNTVIREVLLPQAGITFSETEWAALLALTPDEQRDWVEMRLARARRQQRSKSA